MHQPYQPSGEPHECSCTGDFWLLHDGRAERDGTNTPPTRATPLFDDQRVAIAMLLAEDKTQENGNRPELEQTQNTTRCQSGRGACSGKTASRPSARHREAELGLLPVRSRPANAAARLKPAR